MSANTARNGKVDETTARRERFLQLLGQAGDLTLRGKRDNIFADEKLANPFLEVIQTFKENRGIEVISDPLELYKYWGIPLLVGPDVISSIFNISCRWSDFPCDFSKRQVESFINRAKIDFQCDVPPIALILFLDKDRSGLPINLPVLAEKFDQNLELDFYRDVDDEASGCVRLMWGLTYTRANPAYLGKDWRVQRELALQREEQILTLSEALYSHLAIKTAVGRWSNSIMRTKSVTETNSIWVSSIAEGNAATDYVRVEAWEDFDHSESPDPDIGLYVAVISGIKSEE